MDRNFETHVKLVGWLHIALGFFGLCIASIVFIAIVGGGLISGDAQAMAITAVVGTVVAIILGVLSLPGIIAGFGLLRYYQWARYLTLVISFVHLFNVPVGTLIGGYSIWVLLQDGVAAVFER
jgi:hypothetical protein